MTARGCSRRRVAAATLLLLCHGGAWGASLAGTWESSDQRYRAIVHGPQAPPAVILYGVMGSDGAAGRYVARSVRTGWMGDGLWFRLPPRRLFAGSAGPAGLAGHRSELPPAEAERAGTSWLLRPVDDGVALSCDPPGSAACGLAAPVLLYRRHDAAAAGAHRR